MANADTTSGDSAPRGPASDTDVCFAFFDDHDRLVEATNDHSTVSTGVSCATARKHACRTRINTGASDSRGLAHHLHMRNLSRPAVTRHEHCPATPVLVQGERGARMVYEVHATR